MNAKEYNKIIDQHADHLFRFLVKNTRNDALADDLVQTAFERLWKNRKKVEFKKAKSYLFTVGYNAMIDHFRKNKRMTYSEQLPERSIAPPDTKHFELKEWIEEGLNNLSEINKSLILLRDYEGYSYKEIGEITDLTESQVKVYIFRARKALKEFFTQNYRQELQQYGCK